VAVTNKPVLLPKKTRRRYPMVRSHIAVGVGLVMLAVFLTACTTACTPQERAIDRAEEIAANRAIYEMRNDVEFQNYTKRWMLADDPTAILWCTSSFNTSSSPIFTVPIVGKLTSSAKGPYGRGGGEVPGPDAMYGSPSEFRYGFTPDGSYVDFYNLSTFCTTEPTVWQRESTTVMVAIDRPLAEAQRRAQEQLRVGDAAGAANTLGKALAQ
jgi:hypothetical protein